MHKLHTGQTKLAHISEARHKFISPAFTRLASEASTAFHKLQHASQTAYAEMTSRHRVNRGSYIIDLK
ncbi:hypothetical protein P608_12245 [Comamonas thiooxydans]|uniref:Uncharacterized protein n=1 Tax=Comamonas thiooxydans TaxID=363952 RepID=A0A0E3BV11_9BURK|nr:hypothetical protein P608_12245 [Comamonas thiooxydans]KGH19055.1 hypothetical protein P607_12565 [Comamonas thiooxydans]